MQLVDFLGLCINPLNAELNSICYLLALLGAHHFLHVSRIRVKLLTFRRLMSYIYMYIYIYMGHPFLMFLDCTQRRTTVGRTPLDEWSARRRDLYLTTHDTHNRQISMPPVGFEPTISAGERGQSPYLSQLVMKSECNNMHGERIKIGRGCLRRGCWGRYLGQGGRGNRGVEKTT